MANIRKIVDTICLLTASLSRDEDEFESWGRDFIRLVEDSQCAVLEKTGATKYSYCIGNGFSVVTRDDADEFIIVDNIADELKRNMIGVDQETDSDFEIYISNFLRHIVSSRQSYDARVRSVCRRFCVLFHFQAQKFIELEKSIVDEICLSDVHGLTAFPLETALDKSRAVSSFRMLRISAAAAAGGALMAFSAQIAAPELFASLLALLGASNPFGQFILGISTLVSVHGLSSMGLMSSIGASVAGYKMLKRTEPIKEFKLEPLHYSTIESVSPLHTLLYLLPPILLSYIEISRKMYFTRGISILFLR